MLEMSPDRMHMEESKDDFPPKHQPWKAPSFELAQQIGELFDDEFMICIQNHIEWWKEIKNRGRSVRASHRQT